MDNIVLKRVGAYFIDLFLVTLIAFTIVQIPFINPYLEKYEETYEKLEKLEKDYKDEKIKEEEYILESKKLSYQIDKYNFPYTLVTTACLFGYFVLFQYYNNGQTFGKKILKIRIKGYKNKKLKFINYFIRGLVLNSILVNILLMISLLVTKSNTYYYLSFGFSIMESLFMYSTIITMLFRKDNRGLHDIISNTKVANCEESKIIEA